MRRANPGARPRRNQAQRQGPPAVAHCQPVSLANTIRQLTAPQGQDKPARSQEHRPPPVATAPLQVSATLATRKIPPLSRPTVMRRGIADRVRNFGHFCNSIRTQLKKTCARACSLLHRSLWKVQVCAPPAPRHGDHRSDSDLTRSIRVCPVARAESESPTHIARARHPRTPAARRGMRGRGPARSGQSESGMLLGQNLQVSRRP